MKNEHLQNEYIQLGGRQGVDYWAQKLGISVTQLHDAILNTGSLQVKVLKSYLKSVGIPASPLKRMVSTVFTRFIKMG